MDSPTDRGPARRWAPVAAAAALLGLWAPIAALLSRPSPDAQIGLGLLALLVLVASAALGTGLAVRAARTPAGDGSSWTSAARAWSVVLSTAGALAPVLGWARLEGGLLLVVSGLGIVAVLVAALVHQRSHGAHPR